MDISIYFAAGSTPIILGLVHAIKLFFKDKRFYPIISIGLGIVLNSFIGYEISASPASSIILGIIAGLSASGLWSGGKSALEKTKRKK